MLHIGLWMAVPVTCSLSMSPNSQANQTWVPKLQLMPTGLIWLHSPGELSLVAQLFQMMVGVGSRNSCHYAVIVGLTLLRCTGIMTILYSVTSRTGSILLVHLDIKCGSQRWVETNFPAKPLLTIVSLRRMVPSMSRARFFRKLFHGLTTMLAFIVMHTLELLIMTRFCWKMEARACLQLECNTLFRRTRWTELYVRLW
jgi:hypothetical protein